MIRPFAGKDTEKIWQREFVRAFSRELQAVAYRKLVMLHSVTKLKSLRIPPANRIKSLKGDRKGQHSIRVNDQYRICFLWKDGDAHDVELVDYH